MLWIARRRCARQRLIEILDNVLCVFRDIVLAELLILESRQDAPKSVV